MLQTVDLVCQRDHRDLFEPLNLVVKPGDCVELLGPNGSGKSTLLNVIGLLDKPTKGKVIVDRKDHSRLSEEQVSEYRNQTVGFVFQSHHLLPSCTVLENVMLPGLAGFNKSEGQDLAGRAEKLLNEVGLGHRKNHLPSQISGGERQRVAVVRALINQPSVLLADEPTGALDRKNSDHLMDLLDQLNTEKHLTLVMVTHSFDCAERMKETYHLNEGTLEKQR